MATITLVLTFLALIAQTLAGNQGQWTTTTTDTWWTPSPTTTSYWSTWTPTSTYTSEYTQQNVIVTVTSTLPCPATSTVVTWVCCDQCETNCQNTPTTTNGGGVGTVTVTSHTTITPTTQTTTATTTSHSVVYATTTSGSLVIVYASTATVATAASDTTATPSLVYAVSSDAQDGTSPTLWPFGMVLAMVASVMIML
ncbi:hypothetical protein LTR10_020118 [Elasticomyces elasticus]|uniref:Uncharacterized protein n=1 Tax=Exophiala sideris TaxID=1016849 RepID=A0ABR0IVT4_9EURO|nr:hypothetical protein LTR10_020118 [Elasticomyces elasticus]KAK5021579.1 hypothetical protein LTS07_010876 [Exophiala sideris]KAK5024789.1 hypothetical protein LTR13_010758 [Exophiala sideris]KAK5049716.1 hypothetical protein LTR69_010900 [Exophiala sideris]KAK5176697.1 hypothetical protein LTR44_010767 [Eurotiomycetes sp. CCFEE 6388]